MFGNAIAGALMIPVIGAGAVGTIATAGAVLTPTLGAGGAGTIAAAAALPTGGVGATVETDRISPDVAIATGNRSFSLAGGPAGPPASCLIDIVRGRAL
jgi:hypothetical protein